MTTSRRSIPTRPGAGQRLRTGRTDRIKPGFARIAHAFTGLAYLAGEPAASRRSGLDLARRLYVGHVGRDRRVACFPSSAKNQEGQCIDLALYELVFRVLDEIAPVYPEEGVSASGWAPTPSMSFPIAIIRHRTATGSPSPVQATDVRAAGGSHATAGIGLIRAIRSASSLRLAARDEVNRIVAAWVATLDLEYGSRASCSKGRRAGQPHFQHRGHLRGLRNIVHAGNIQMTDLRAGEIAVPGVVPRLSSTPGEIRWLGAGIGCAERRTSRC